MNTNPKAKRILCYGDSNTWGYEPGTGRRIPADHSGLAEAIYQETLSLEI